MHTRINRENSMASKPTQRPLNEITEIPQPPQAAVDQAKAAGAEIVAYDPRMVEKFITGQITLGDLEGISKQSQLDMADVGYRYLEEGKLDLARDVFIGLCALDPFDAYFQTALGSIAQRSGNLDEAEARYSRALEINPFSPAALANRGEVRILKGMLVEAAEDLAGALKNDPDGNEPATQRARVMVQTVRTQLEAAAKQG